MMEDIFQTISQQRLNFHTQISLIETRSNLDTEYRSIDLLGHNSTDEDILQSINFDRHWNDTLFSPRLANCTNDLSHEDANRRISYYSNSNNQIDEDIEKLDDAGDIPRDRCSTTYHWISAGQELLG
jgi:hypothetical protein